MHFLRAALDGCHVLGRKVGHRTRHGKDMFASGKLDECMARRAVAGAAGIRVGRCSETTLVVPLHASSGWRRAAKGMAEPSWNLLYLRTPFRSSCGVPFFMTLGETKSIIARMPQQVVAKHPQ